MDDDWADAVGWIAVIAALLLGGLAAVFGYRCCRWLLSALGFLLFAVPTNCLLYYNLSSISISAHDILFISLAIGFLGVLVTHVFWRRCLFLYAVALGLLMSFQLMALPFVMNGDPSLYDAQVLYPGLVGGVLFFAFFQIYFEKLVIILSTSACGTFAVASVLDLITQTGATRRFFAVVSAAVHCDELFLVNIGYDTFDDGPGASDSEEYFVVLSWILLAAVLAMVQRFVTARKHNHALSKKEQSVFVADVPSPDESSPLLRKSWEPRSRSINVTEEASNDDDFFHTHRRVV